MSYKVISYLSVLALCGVACSSAPSVRPSDENTSSSKNKEVAVEANEDVAIYVDGRKVDVKTCSFLKADMRKVSREARIRVLDRAKKLNHPNVMLLDNHSIKALLSAQIADTTLYIDSVNSIIHSGCADKSSEKIELVEKVKFVQHVRKSYQDILNKVKLNEHLGL